MQSFTRRATVGLLTSQWAIRGQKARPITYAVLKPALDAIYADILASQAAGASSLEIVMAREGLEFEV